uniref:Metalloendopeptidase n=1 Tax=Kryptolebias marmoratus TaxID=37003 RepID=A0A3Q3AYJ2_KRYMA
CSSDVPNEALDVIDHVTRRYEPGHSADLTLSGFYQKMLKRRTSGFVLELHDGTVASKQVGPEFHTPRVFIVRALDTFRVKSCIDFKVWDTEEYYLNIVKLIGCWSYVGQVFANGQNLSIGAGCESHGVVEHEILHALGFYHEQSRYDRDDYVDIVFNNIKTGQEHNFRKVGSDESSTHGTPYDYFSVMHYNKDAFTNGNGSTIITIDPKYQDVIGQRLDMSPLDVQELNLLYKCGKR